MSRGSAWFTALTGHSGHCAVWHADADCAGTPARFVAVVPDAATRFPRARAGQVGLEQGWDIAAAVREVIDADRGKTPRAIVIVVDVPGQAFGFAEEALGLHEALAAAVDAYATARLAGHPVVALIVGKAISGAFLAHGLQAGAVLALDDSAIEVHVMSQAAVARITRRSEADIAALARIVPSTSRDVHAFAQLGAVDALLPVSNAEAPTAADVGRVRAALAGQIAALRETPRAPGDRLGNAAARSARAMSILVRQQLEAQWDAPA